MMAMYTRLLTLPTQSFFLLGPRGTGKTTWLKSVLPGSKYFDLLRSTEHIRLMRNPDEFRQEIAALKKGSWVVVDEIQKLPILLDEIHSIMNDFPKQYNFALSGSSARKLKRSGVNLLAGRAINRHLLPLTGSEMNYDFHEEDIVKYGMLPAVRNLSHDHDRVDFLDAYIANYLQEEIQQEALVKNLASFTRFLSVASLFHGQVTNVAGIARDAGVQRPTVQGYFDVLTDTLIGRWLPAWTPRMKVKEKVHPKFYFFDPGVVQSISPKSQDFNTSDRRGFFIESIVMNELLAAKYYHGIKGEFYYWSTPSGTEVDFIWKGLKSSIGIEVKATKQWKTSYGNPLRELHAEKFIDREFGVYLGERILKDNNVWIFPLKEFMKKCASADLW